MPTTEPLDDFELNTYEATVPVYLENHDDPDVLIHDIRETAARAICDHVDELDEGDAAYVTTQVTFDEEQFRDVFEDDDIEFVDVETVTQLGVVDETDTTDDTDTTEDTDDD